MPKATRSDSTRLIARDVDCDWMSQFAVSFIADIFPKNLGQTQVGRAKLLFFAQIWCNYSPLAHVAHLDACDLDGNVFPRD
jgi:hypothetical protein